MGYVDLATIHVPATGGIAPASWGTQVRDNDVATAKPPACKVRRTTNQSIATATSTNLIFDTEDYDTANIWVPGTPDTFTIPTAGKWGLAFGAQFAISTTGLRLLFIQVGATVVSIFNSVGNPTWYVGSSVYAEASLAAGDLVKFVVHQTSGAALNVDVAYPVWAAAHLIAY